MTKTTKSTQRNWKKWILAAIVLFALLPFFLLAPYAMYHFFGILPFGGDSALMNAGMFGDSFGVLTCLFSGGAFGGVLYTIHLQRKEIRLAEEEHRKSDKDRQRAEKQREEMHEKTVKMTALAALLPVYHDALQKSPIPDKKLMKKRNFVLDQLAEAVGVDKLE